MDEKALPRFQVKIRRELRTGCWIWTAGRSRGYGVFHIGGKRYYAHRVSYMHYVGPIPGGLHIDHLCRNRLCVHPDHLEPVSQGVNNQRAVRANKVTCIHGHPFTEENTWVNPRNGHRSCRACWRERTRAYKARKRAA